MNTPHSDLPRVGYPGRPYDHAAPYDWAIEEVFDAPTEASSDSPSLSIGEKIKVAGALVLTAATLVALAAYEFRGSDDAKVEAQDIPAALPPAVKHSAASAVKIEVDYEDSYGYTSGSGLKVGPDMVMTAGHIVMDDSAPDDRIDCDSSQVVSKRISGYDSLRHPIRNFHGVDTAALDKSIGINGRDLAVLQVESNPAFDQIPAAVITAKQPETGDAVFFVNYESGQDSDSVHYPYDGTPGYHFFGGETYYHHPAQYAGTVVADRGDFLMVATGEQGYGPQEGREVHTYGGASGGPVFNQEGEVIGMSVGIMFDGQSVGYIRRYDNVELAPEPLTRRISLVQSVTPDTLRSLSAALPKQQNC